MRGIAHAAQGFSLAAALLVAAAAVQAQADRTVPLRVAETAGIRRTEYPVNARVPFAKGALADADHVALRLDDADVAAQFTIESTWDDGSVRSLAVDFNASIGPLEARAYSLAHGAGINRPASVPRGLTLVEEGDAIQVGNVKFGRSGAPLILSANYRGEFIGKGRNGVTLVDAAGARHDLAGAQLSVRIVRRGPLFVVLEYTGKLALDGGYAVPVTLTVAMPNSKSWVRTTVAVGDPGKRIRSVAFETPFSFGEKPWLWDMATANGTYGAFRNPGDAVLMTQTIGAKNAGRWTVQTGMQNELRPYEASTPARSAIGSGSGHFLDAARAVAFAVDRFGTEQGIYTIGLDGQGQAAFSFAPAQPAAEHRLTVYEHFVSTPVPIGAATNPAAMLSPLAVTVGK